MDENEKVTKTGWIPHYLETPSNLQQAHRDKFTIQSEIYNPIFFGWEI